MIDERSSHPKVKKTILEPQTEIEVMASRTFVDHLTAVLLTCLHQKNQVFFIALSWTHTTWQKFSINKIVLHYRFAQNITNLTNVRYSKVTEDLKYFTIVNIIPLLNYELTWSTFNQLNMPHLDSGTKDREKLSLS